MNKTVKLGDGPEINRLAYGTMQLPGEGVWGPSKDPEGAKEVLRRAVDLGVDFFDTANSYGPYVAEELLREALHPYDGITIGTKAGLLRTGPGEWHQLGRPEYLRQELEMSLRRLGVEQIDLFQLHRIDSRVPAEEQIGVLSDMKDEGKINQIGLSEVGVEQIEMAREITEIVSVQNLYNLSNRSAEEVVDYCDQEGIVFIPWFPLASRALADPDGPLKEIGAELDATPSQLALAWLLHRSPVIVPIPGTRSIAHLEENVAAADVGMTDEITERLSAIAR